MQESVQKTKFHQKAYHHIRKHKKNYVRMVLFFIFLVLYSIVEDIIAMTVHGVEFDMIIVINVFFIALIFTGIAQMTERLYKEEKDEIKEYEKKVGKVIKKEEDFLEDEEKMIERKIKGKK